MCAHVNKSQEVHVCLKKSLQKILKSEYMYFNFFLLLEPVYIRYIRDRVNTLVSKIHMFLFLLLSIQAILV